MFYQKKWFARKSCYNKKIWIFCVRQRIKSTNDIAKKQYQGLSKFFKSDEKEKLTIKKYNESDLIYNSKYRFYKYYSDSKKIDNFSSKSKYSFPNFLMI